MQNTEEEVKKQLEAVEADNKAKKEHIHELQSISREFQSFEEGEEQKNEDPDALLKNL